jgi:hypothetical protein
MDETPEVNPYESLGLDASFVDDLLKESAEGDAVRIVAGGMFRVLSRRYHSDVPETGDATRFQEIKSASTRIETATPGQLKRWAKVERVAAGIQIGKMREEADERVGKVSELVQLNMELGNNPRHFSQLRWAQGVLLHQNRSTLLARADGQGLEVTRGDRQTAHSTVSFQGFMKKSKFFGLEPGKRYTTFIDETGRTSLLESDLTYIMDISDPVDAFRHRKKKENERELDELWAQSDEPLLLTSQIPDPTKEGEQTPDQMIIFRDTMRNIPTKWRVDMDVSGSTSNPNFFRRIRHRNAAGATALGGSTSAQASHFNVIPTSVEEMAAQGAGYSPLIDPGTSLVLFDPANRTPVATDTRILGMIGNGPQYA